MTAVSCEQKDRNPDPEEMDIGAMDMFLALRKPGAPDPRMKIIVSYLDSSPKLMEKICSAVEAGDAVALRKGVHSLKSSSMIVGAKRLSTICGEIERSCMAGNLGEVGDLLTQAQAKYGEATDVLRAALAEMEQSKSF